jgi:hypothetical protein
MLEALDLGRGFRFCITNNLMVSPALSADAVVDVSHFSVPRFSLLVSRFSFLVCRFSFYLFSLKPQAAPTARNSS